MSFHVILPLWIRIRSGFIRLPGSGFSGLPGNGSRREKITHKISVADPHPGSGDFLTPGSGIGKKIPDRQHCKK
jgi:hypothetical protein